VLLAFAVHRSCPGFPDNCLFIQFAFLEDVADVLGNRAFIPLKQFHHLRLSQPDGFILKVDIQGGLPVFGLVENDGAVIGG